MKKCERERLERLYLTKVEAAMRKRSIGYRLLAEAEDEMASAKEILMKTKGEINDGKQEAEKE
jgi:hypothetical protein